jgi:hypothetical protein
MLQINCNRKTMWKGSQQSPSQSLWALTSSDQSQSFPKLPILPLGFHWVKLQVTYLIDHYLNVPMRGKARQSWFLHNVIQLILCFACSLISEHSGREKYAFLEKKIFPRELFSGKPGHLQRWGQPGSALSRWPLLRWTAGETQLDDP